MNRKRIAIQSASVTEVAIEMENQTGNSKICCNCEIDAFMLNESNGNKVDVFDPSDLSAKTRRSVCQIVVAQLEVIVHRFVSIEISK